MGNKIVQCHGTFDLIHPGHVIHFEESKGMGDVLIVTVTGEKFVNKGPRRPYFNDELRLRSLTALESVDYVAIIPYPAAVEAIEAADLVVLGPGSWFSSVIPHVLVPELLAALDRSTAHKVLVLNLAPELGETTGFSAERHLHVLSQHAPDFRVDHIVVDSAFVPQGGERDHLARAASRLGAEIVYVDVAESGSHAHHFGKLAAALGSIVTSGDDTATDVPRREGITSWP